METAKKYQNLKTYLKDLGGAAVAFSGGVDSTFLLKVAHDVLGENIIAVTAASPIFPKRERDEATHFCKEQGIKQVMCPSEEMTDDTFRRNPPDRCYTCKKNLFGKILRIAAEHDIKNIIEGTNADDTGDYRPGLKAIDELGIKSPLKAVGLSKAEIRGLSREMNLPTWSKPSFACLATRFPYGDEISEEALAMIDRAEEFLADKGIRQIRVRIHQNLARIELFPEEFEQIMEEKLRREVTTTLKSYGFSYVALDLEGYRTGSMNETLSERSNNNVR